MNFRSGPDLALAVCGGDEHESYNRNRLRRDNAGLCCLWGADDFLQSIEYGERLAEELDSLLATG